MKDMMTHKHTLYGHEKYVYEAAFSPDGRILATASYDEQVILWDTQTGEQIRAFDKHIKGAHAVIFSPDEPLLVSGDCAGGIKLWEYRTGELQRDLEGHTGNIETFTFSPEGKIFASCSADKKVGDGIERDSTVRLWDTKSWTTKLVLQGHGTDVCSVDFSPDGQTLLTSSDDGSARLWDAQTGELKHRLKWQRLPLLWAVFSPDGKTFVTAGYIEEGEKNFIGEVRFWNTRTMELEAALRENCGAVFCIAFSKDGKFLVGSTADGQLLIWDAQTRVLLQAIQAHDKTELVPYVVFSPDNAMVATASFDHTARIWNFNGNTNPA